MITKKDRSQYYNKDYYREREYKDLDPYLKYILINWAIPGKKFLEEKKKIRILDVGCGIGIYINFLKSQGYTVYGIDYSSSAVKISRQIQASATCLPFQDSSFDAVIAAHLIEHLTPEEIRKFLKEITRVSKNVGNVFLLTPNTWSIRRLFNRKNWFRDPAHINMFNPSKMEKVLKENNFVNIRFRFKIPLFLQRGTVEKWVMPYSGPFWIVRKCFFLQGVLFFLFTATPLAYFRDVIYTSAQIRK